MFTISQHRGYSLVEVLVAISILLIALVGPMTIAVKGLQSSYYAREETTALFLAQEGVEVFVALRNEAMMESLNSNGDFSTGWDWTTDPSLAVDDCFDPTGCNIDVESVAGANNSVLNDLNIQSCASGCVLQDRGATFNRARYGFSGTPTKFTRVIKLTADPDPSADGVLIESTVSWTSALFGATTRNVTLNGAIYRTY